MTFQKQNTYKITSYRPLPNRLSSKINGKHINTPKLSPL